MRKIATLFLIGLLVVGVGVFAAEKKVVNVMHGWPGLASRHPSFR